MEQNPGMSRYERALEALDHPTQRSTERGYPECDELTGGALIPFPPEGWVIDCEPYGTWEHGWWFYTSSNGSFPTSTGIVVPEGS